MVERKCVRRRRAEDGAAAVEFALIMPILLILVFGAVQYGMYFYSMQSGTAAVGEVARRMTVGDCQTAAEVRTFVYGRLGAATTASSASGVTITTEYTKADGTTSAPSPGEIGGTVKVTAEFQALNLHFPFVPVPGGGIVTRSATARIEETTSGGCS